jgi:hypothetical protein
VGSRMVIPAARPAKLDADGRQPFGGDSSSTSVSLHTVVALLIKIADSKRASRTRPAGMIRVQFPIR